MEENMLTAGMFVADRYEIIEKIGAGGMSDVYKARDHVLGRFVAIKVLKQEFSEDVNFVTKFRTEAQSAAGLEHPNIVNIYDVGSESGMHYIVMEYVEGVTLKTYIQKKGRLTYKEAVSIAIQVGRGIEAAHAKHIIHRDIKPQNILISTEGKAKVTDFGIARAVSNNTISADVMGSVHYASPEQARNGFVDGKSDIYSLGIVMYEMVTGRVPFDGETTVAVAIQHLQEEMVAPSTYAPDLPVSLEKIILKCTQKSPDRRYPTISDLLIDLKKVLISPNEDFVTMIPNGVEGKTRAISQDEVKKIKEGRTSVHAEKKHPVREEVYETESEEEEDPDDEGFLNPRMEKAITIGAIVTAVIIAAVLLYLAGNILGIFGGSHSKKKQNTDEHSVISTEQKKADQVSMIKVTGMTMDEAKTALNKIELGIRSDGTQASDEYPQGQIISQDVDEGTKVDVNTTIHVYISSGAAQGSSSTDNSSTDSTQTVEVPSVEGTDSDAAVKTIEDKGLVADRTYQQSDTVAAGNVISQTPSAGSTAKKGDTVKLVVSQGKGLVKVPDVYNKTQDEATTLLTQAGLKVTSTSTDYSDTVAEGHVISQSIVADKEVDQGSNVSLVISLGSKITYYYCKATIGAPDSDEVTAADIKLTDADGNELQSWNGINISKFPYTISVSDIKGTDNGTITITWYLSDGSSTEQSKNVAFSKQ